MEKKKDIDVALRYKNSGKVIHIKVSQSDLPSENGTASNPCGLHKKVQQMNDDLNDKKIKDKLIIQSIGQE